MKAHDAGLKGTLTDNGDGTATFTMAALNDGDTVSIGGKNYTIGSLKADADKLVAAPGTGTKKLTIGDKTFVLKAGDTKVYDEIITVENDDAFTTGKLLAKHEGVLVGISSGAALWAAIDYAKRPENKGKTIVALLPDNGDRYYSTPLFAE